MGETTTNKHGRKPGRGIRPWLLMPKVLAVAIYFGSAATATVLWFRQSIIADNEREAPAATSLEIAKAEHAADRRMLDLIDQLSFLFRFVIVPALLVAMLFGILLLLQHPRVLSKMRWWRVKMVSLAVFIPVMHFFMSSRLETLRDVYMKGGETDALQTQLSVGLIVTLLCSAWFIFLGRHKPRLGQNLAKALKR